MSMEGVAGSMIGRRAEALARDESVMSRRDMMLTTIANVSSTGIASGVVIERALHARKAEASNVVPFPQREGTASEEAGSQSAESGSLGYRVPRELVGKKLSGLEREYLGNAIGEGPLPEVLPSVPFDQNIRAMLETKTGLIVGVRDSGKQGQAYEALADSYETLWDRNRLRTMDLAGFRSLIERESYKMLDALDGRYDDIARTYFTPNLERTGVPTEEAKRYGESMGNMLRYLAQHITPEVQLAYIATEIMPAPERGAALLSFLMEHAGVEFIERIPALGDQLLSYGPYQLTPFVVGDEGSVTQLTKVMRKPDLIPEDLAKFSSVEDHMHAGFLFAVHNLMTLMLDAAKGGRYDELLTLCESASSGSVDGRSTVFLEYLSAAHHRPVVAREVMQTWLSRNKSKSKQSREKTLAHSFGNSPADEQVKTYAHKAQQHFMHILRYLDRSPE